MQLQSLRCSLRLSLIQQIDTCCLYLNILAAVHNHACLRLSPPAHHLHEPMGVVSPHSHWKQTFNDFFFAHKAQSVSLRMHVRCGFTLWLKNEWQTCHCKTQLEHKEKCIIHTDTLLSGSLECQARGRVVLQCFINLWHQFDKTASVGNHKLAGTISLASNRHKNIIQTDSGLFMKSFLLQTFLCDGCIYINILTSNFNGRPCSYVPHSRLL